MDISSRLTQIVGYDASQKAEIAGNKKLLPAMIHNGFSITSGVNHSMAVIPANMNRVTSRDTLVHSFAHNRNEAVYGVVTEMPETAAPVVTIDSIQKIKTRIFSSYGVKIVEMQPMLRFENAKTEKLAQPERSSRSAYTMEDYDRQQPRYVGNVHQLDMYRKKIS